MAFWSLKFEKMAGKITGMSHDITIVIWNVGIELENPRQFKFLKLVQKWRRYDVLKSLGSMGCVQHEANWTSELYTIFDVGMFLAVL